MADWRSFILNETSRWITDNDKLIHFEEVEYEKAVTNYPGYLKVHKSQSKMYTSL